MFGNPALATPEVAATVRTLPQPTKRSTNLVSRAFWRMLSHPPEMMREFPAGSASWVEIITTALLSAAVIRWAIWSAKSTVMNDWPDLEEHSHNTTLDAAEAGLSLNQRSTSASSCSER